MRIRLLLSCIIITMFSAGVFAQSTSPNPVRRQQTVQSVLPPPANSSAVITFSEYPVNTTILNQYRNIGIIFGGSGPFISTDGSNPTSPVLSGTPRFNGDITGRFVVPGTDIPTIVKSFTYDAGYFDNIGSTRMEWFDPNGVKLGQRINSIFGIETFTIEGGNIASWRISVVADEPAGYAIDNISFVPTGPSVIFRESNEDKDKGTFGRFDEVPGWDHTAFQIENKVYESHPGYDAATYVSEDGKESVNMVPVFGVQSQHTRGTFLNDGILGKERKTIAIDEIPVDQDLAVKMRSNIESVMGKPFQKLDYFSLKGIQETLVPAVQKGKNNTFTCVGLVEWSAEQSNHNGGQGFIPNRLESFTINDIEIPFLSPQLLNFSMKYPTLAFLSKLFLQILFDPVDFTLTDPFGRRLGYVQGVDSVNEIPFSMYPGNGILEQVLIPSALPGPYVLRIVGTGDSAFVAVSASDASTIYSGLLQKGETIERQIFINPTPGCKGDVNGDGTISERDVTALLPRLNRFTEGLTDPGDLDFDGLISNADLSLLRRLIVILACDVSSLDLGPDKTVNLFYPDSACTTLSVNGIDSAAASNYTYRWSTGDTTATINVCPATTTVYSVTVTKESCTFTDSVTVIVNRCPADLIVTAPSCNDRVIINWNEPVDTYPSTIAIPQALDPGTGKLTYIGSLNGHGYYKSNDAYPWPVARDITEYIGRSGVKGHLATLTDETENNFIYNKIKNNSYLPWIGLYNTGRVGRFRWVTNEDFSFSKWQPGEPNNFGGNARNIAEPYVQISGGNGNWNDVSSNALPFIAEFDKPLLKYRQISGPKNGSARRAGVYQVCYERTNTITGQKDTCCFNVTVQCEGSVIEDQAPITVAPPHTINEAIAGFNVIASPNPSPGNFTLKVTSDDNKARINLKVTDITGREIELRNGIVPNQVIQIGNNYKPGLYLVQVLQGSRKVVVKLIKQSR